jgi:hypothetical protein
MGQTQFGVNATRQRQKLHFCAKMGFNGLLRPKQKLTLTRFKTRVFFINDIDAATATNYTVCAMAALQGLERVLDFHLIVPKFHKLKSTLL